jgi:hypothetical protein
MNEENQIKTVVLLGVTNIMIQYIEDITMDHPNLIRHGLKRSLNNAISEIEKQHERIFIGLQGEQRIGVAEQINDISLRFHDFVFNEFKFDNNK